MCVANEVWSAEIAADGDICAVVTTFGDSDWNGSGQLSAGQIGAPQIGPVQCIVAQMGAEQLLGLDHAQELSRMPVPDLGHERS